MNDFRKAAKILKDYIHHEIVEGVSEDPAVRFCYSEALIVRMNQAWNQVFHMDKDYVELRALNAMFGDGEFVVPQYLHDATDFIKFLPDEDVKHLEVSVEFELRDYWLPPLIKAITLECKSNGMKTRFENDGEFYCEDFLSLMSEK